MYDSLYRESYFFEFSAKNGTKIFYQRQKYKETKKERPAN